MPEAYRGTILNPTGNNEQPFEQIDDGVVVVIDGKILVIDSVHEILNGSKNYPRLGFSMNGRNLSFQGAILHKSQTAILPSTNNFHDHTFQPPGIPGVLLQETAEGLKGWLPTTLKEGEWKAKNNLVIAENMARVRLKSFAAAGIGRVLQYTTSSVEAAEKVLKIAEELGLMVQVGYVVMDQGIDGIQTGLQTTGDEAVKATKKLLEKYSGGRYRRIVVVDRFPICVSSSTRRRLAALAKEFGAGYETHADESRNEIEFHKSLYDGRSIVQVLIDDGVFEPGSNVGLAHAIHTDVRDMDRIGDLIVHGSQVSLRLCPSSNASLGSHWDGESYIEFPLTEWEKRGVTLTLGTDRGAGRNTNIFREAMEEKQRHPVNHRPTNTELLRYATINGIGQTFSVQDIRIDVGKRANFVVVKMAGAEAFYDGHEHHGDPERTAVRIIEGGQDSTNVLAGYVDGRKFK